MRSIPSVRYTVTDLGTLPGGHYSSATAINDHGQVVGWADTGATKGVLTAHAFLWQNGVMRDIDTLPQLQKAPGTVARAINDFGEVAGDVEPEAEPNANLAYQFILAGWFWHKGVMQEVGGGASAINDKGQVLISTPPNGHSLIWRGGRTEEIAAIPGFQFVTATAINNHGDIAGYCGNSPGEAKGFVRIGSKVVMLGTLPGQNTSQPIAINDKRQVIGTSSDTFYHQDGNTTTSGTRSSSAFFWQNGVMTDLPYRDVWGLGEQGQVLGSYTYRPTGGQWMTVAYVWQAGTSTDLNTAVAQASGWKLETATAINKRGQIVGEGEHDGQRHAFLLTPTLTAPRRNR